MRKTISCRVIRSIPLGVSGDAPRRASRLADKQTKISDTAVFTYTNRLDVKRASVDEDLAAQILDFYA